MKQILFKGKRKDNGEWVEGYYAKATDYLTNREIHLIFPVDLELYPHSEFSSYEEVDPETVVRLIDHPCYDGVWDDERRFFEGDIIGVYRHRHADIASEEPDSMAIVVNESCITENGLGHWFPQDTIRVRVVGNVYDNPDLVGKQHADSYKYSYGYMSSVTEEDLRRNYEEE